MRKNKKDLGVREQATRDVESSDYKFMMRILIFLFKGRLHQKALLNLPNLTQLFNSSQYDHLLN